MKIALTSVHVTDPMKAFTFYTETLGFIQRVYMPEYNLAIVASPEEPGGTGLLLEPSDNPIAKAYMEGIYQAGMPIIVFGITDLQAEYERLKGLGVKFTQEPTKSDMGITAVFDDTCGNFVQLHQMI